MTHLNDSAIQSSVRDFLSIDDWNSPFAVTLTMKQRLMGELNGNPSFTKLDRYEASKNLKHFLNKLNRRLFKNSHARFGKRVRVIPILEGGSGTNLHWHLVIECPRDDLVDVFPSMIDSLWRATNWGDVQTHIAPCDAGWLDYITKRRSKPDFGTSIDWELLEH